LRSEEDPEECLNWRWHIIPSRAKVRRPDLNRSA
jgi:hypothetical protein